MNFSELQFQPHHMGNGKQAVHFFPNGYGASVVCTDYSYGGNVGLYELAVIKGKPDAWELTYGTPVTSDVEGRLTEEQVTSLLSQIEALPAEEAE